MWRTLAIGIIAALLGAYLHSALELPTEPSLATAAGSTFHLDTAKAMWKNPLQIARVALGPRGFYKTSGTAAAFKPSIQSTSIVETNRRAPATPIPQRHFATTPSMASSKSFIQAVKDRRTYYALNKEAPISDDAIVELAKNALLHVPSSFNSQSTRLVVLLKKEHDTFWDFTKEVLKPMVPAEQFEGTEKKIDGFKAGYGTILFFEDPTPVQNLQKAFPLYAHHFPDWSEHTSAMHQYVLWAGLEAEGFGANLQHYNPVIDQKAMTHWNVPLDWKLRSQLVFGGKAGEPGKKDFKPVEGERLFVYGKDS